MPAVRQRRIRRGRFALHAFLIAMSALWLFPLAWAVYTSFRPYSDTQHLGYMSLPETPQHRQLRQRLEPGGAAPYFYLNTIIIAVPGVILTLFVSSMVAFGLVRFSGRFNLVLLMLFTAGNLLPPQVIIVPLFHLYLFLPIPKFISDNGLLYDQYIGIILIHVVFQTGFCVFVLSNYMRTISKELIEAALVDGASVFRIYRERHPAALPARPGRPGDPRVHVHLQRLLLGAAAHEVGRPTADHLGPQQPPGPVLHRTTTCSRRAR